MFGEVMAHFVWGSDEKSICTDHNGNVKIIGSAGERKHKNILQDSRVSITLVRTGSAGGSTDPTDFLLKGENATVIILIVFLEDRGLAPGSTVIMTENSFMTNVAWAQCTKRLIKGYRSVTYMKENPQRDIVKLLDGFLSHERVLFAIKARKKAGIVSLKEDCRLASIHE